MAFAPQLTYDCTQNERLSMRGALYIMAENRKKEPNSAENRKGEVVNPGKQKKKLRKAGKPL